MASLNGKEQKGDERVVLIDERWLMEMELKLVKLMKLLCDRGCHVDGGQYKLVQCFFKRLPIATEIVHLLQRTQKHQDYQLYSSKLRQHQMIIKEHPLPILLTNNHHHHHQIKVYMFFTTTMTQNNQQQTKNPTHTSNTIQIMGEKRTILQIKKLQQSPSQNIKNKTNNDNSLQSMAMMGDENCQQYKEQNSYQQKQHHQHQSSSSNNSSSPNGMISSSYDSNCDSISNPVAFILRQKNNQNNKRNLQQNSNNNVFNNCVTFGKHGMEEIDCQPVFYYYGQFNNNNNGNDNSNSNKDGNEIQNTINYNNSLIHIDVDRKGHQQHGGQTKYNNTQTQNTTTTSTSFKRDSSGMNLPLNNTLTLKNTLNNTLNNTLTLKNNKIPTDRQQQMMRLAIIQKEKITKKKIQKRKKETRKLLLQQEDDQQQQQQIVSYGLNKRVESVRNNNGIEYSFINVNINNNNNNINQINQNCSSNLFINHNTQTLSPSSLSPPTLLTPTAVSNNNIQTQHSIITRNVRLQSNKQLDKLITTYNNNSQQLRGVDKQWNNQGDNNRREGINIKQNVYDDKLFVGDISNKKRVKSNQQGDVQKSNNMNVNMKQQQHYLQQQQHHLQQQQKHGQQPSQQYHLQQQQQLQHQIVSYNHQEPTTTTTPPLLQQSQLLHQQFHAHNYLNNQHLQQQQQSRSHIHPLSVYSSNNYQFSQITNRGYNDGVVDNLINSGIINCDELTVQEMMLMELLYSCPTYCVHPDYIYVNTNMNLNVNVNNQHYQQQRQQQYHQQQQLLHKQQQYQQKINTFNNDYNNNSLIRQLTKQFKQLLTYQTNTVDEFNQFIVQKMFYLNEKQYQKQEVNINNNQQHHYQLTEDIHQLIANPSIINNKPLTLHLLIQVMKQTQQQLTLQLIKQANRLHSYSQQQQQHRQMSLYQHIQHICNNNDNNVEIMMSSLRQIIQGEFQSNVDKVIDLTTTTTTKSGIDNSCDKEKSDTGKIAIKSQQQLTGRQLQLYQLIKDYVSSNNMNHNNNVISYSQQKHNQYKFESILNQFVNVLQIDCSAADYCCCNNNHDKDKNNNKQKQKQKQKQNNLPLPPPLNSQSQQPPLSTNITTTQEKRQQQQITTIQYKLTNYIENMQIKVRQLQQMVNTIMYDVLGYGNKNNNNKSDNNYQHHGIQMMDCVSGEVFTYYPHYDMENNHYNQFVKSIQLNQQNDLNTSSSLYHHQSNTGSMLTQQLYQTSLLTQSVQRFMSQKFKHSTTNCSGMNSFNYDNNNNNNNFHQSNNIQQTIMNDITQNSGDDNVMVDQQQIQSIKHTVTTIIKMLDHILADVQLMTIQLNIMY